MRVKHPSWFGVVALVVVLVFGCGLNLYVAHIKSEFGPKPRGVTRSFVDSAEADVRSMLPKDLVDDGYRATHLGADIYWLYGWYGYGIIREDVTQLQSSGDDPMQNQSDILFVERYGGPFVSRSSSFAIRAWYAEDSSRNGGFYETVAGPKRVEQIWPTPLEGEAHGPRSVSYHPIGLILNPIIYTLPIWLLVMGLRWALLKLHSRKRSRLGLCTSCGYDLAGLNVCPECGNAPTA
jgi:hypothetical protein